MTRQTTNTKTGLAVHEVAARLAAWIINGYGAQDWLDKIDEHAEPVAAVLRLDLDEAALKQATRATLERELNR